MEFKVIVDMMSSRLDGHGQDIKAMWEELSIVRQEINTGQKDILEKIHELQLSSAKENAATSRKMAAISAFVSGIVVAVTHFAHKVF